MGTWGHRDMGARGTRGHRDMGDMGTRGSVSRYAGCAPCTGGLRPAPGTDSGLGAPPPEAAADDVGTQEP